MMKNRKILITGGAGFIGSNLCSALADANDIVCIDNYLMGSVSNHKKGPRYVNGCVSDINQLLADDDFDLVFHLGEYSRVEQSIEEPLITFKNTIIPFPALLDFVRARGAKLIYSGSSTKFAKGTEGSSLSPYSFSKSSNTELLKNYARWYGLDYAITYFYNVFGKGELQNGKYATVVGKFGALYKEGKRTFPVSRPGTQLRNFTHVDDIISGLIAVAEKGSGDKFGIGNEQAYSILDICEMFGCSPEFYDAGSANRLGSGLEIQNTLDLGWRAEKSLETFIRELKEQA